MAGRAPFSDGKGPRTLFTAPECDSDATELAATCRQRDIDDTLIGLSNAGPLRGRSLAASFVKRCPASEIRPLAQDQPSGESLTRRLNDGAKVAKYIPRLDRSPQEFNGGLLSI